jgi:hypothetical protein
MLRRFEGLERRRVRRWREDLRGRRVERVMVWLKRRELRSRVRVLMGAFWIGFKAKSKGSSSKNFVCTFSLYTNANVLTFEKVFNLAELRVLNTFSNELSAHFVIESERYFKETYLKDLKRSWMNSGWVPENLLKERESEVRRLRRGRNLGKRERIWTLRAIETE